MAGHQTFVALVYDFVYPMQAPSHATPSGSAFPLLDLQPLIVSAVAEEHQAKPARRYVRIFAMEVACFHLCAACLLLCACERIQSQSRPSVHSFLSVYDLGDLRRVSSEPHEQCLSPSQLRLSRLSAFYCRHANPSILQLTSELSNSSAVVLRPGLT